MDYVTREFVNLIKKLRDDVQKGVSALHSDLLKLADQQSSSIAKADERNQQDHKIQNERLENILVQNNKIERYETTKNDPSYSVQNWIRWGTWAAVLAGCVYAGIAAFQWKDANDNFAVSQRAWIGVNGPIKIDSISLDQKGAGKASFTVPIKNYGNSVALDVSIWAEAINGFDTMDHASGETCQYADAFSNLRHSKHMKSPGAAVDFPQQVSPGLMFQGEANEHPFREVVIQNSKVPLGFAVIGCISYKDQFGKQRRTRLCYGGPNTGPMGAGSLLFQCAIGINDAN